MPACTQGLNSLSLLEPTSSARLRLSNLIGCA
jgi:hypothetical protein